MPRKTALHTCLDPRPQPPTYCSRRAAPAFPSLRSLPWSHCGKCCRVPLLRSSPQVTKDTTAPCIPQPCANAKRVASESWWDPRGSALKHLSPKPSQTLIIPRSQIRGDGGDVRVTGATPVMARPLPSPATGASTQGHALSAQQRPPTRTLISCSP